MKNIGYTNFILTVVAGLLACSLWIRSDQRVVHAQNASRRLVATRLSDPATLSDGVDGFTKHLNDAVDGGEIVAVASSGHDYLVVYKPRK